MHTVDLVGLCIVALALVVLAAVLARQRYMLRLPGAIALAVTMPARDGRWMYGMGRYVDGQLRWYRALGIGSRPSQVLVRGRVEVLRRRAPVGAELTALPDNVVVLECRGAQGPFTMALSEGAYTGFVSWLESSAPI